MSHYHGHDGFLTFSQAKSVFSRGRISSTRPVYPPYGGWIQRLNSRLYLK
ncbi:hypothetical protein [Halomonas sp. WWR20]